MSDRTTDRSASRSAESRAADCARGAIQALRKAVDEPAAALTQDVDVAERQIAELRNCLILQLREAPAGPESAQTRRLLNEANVALSLVVGVEYPSGGIQRKLLESAQEVLGRAFPAAR
jgi:hypothetical protein